MALSPKHQVFVEEYLTTWNASEAARRAGYTGRANTIGPRLLANVGIAEQIKARVADKAMTADEVLIRLAEHARADLGPWMNDSGDIDIAAMRRMGATRFIRKVKRTERSGVSESGSEWSTETVEIDLHDAQAALVHIGKHHGLFKDSVEHSGETIITVKYGDERTNNPPTQTPPEAS